MHIYSDSVLGTVCYVFQDLPSTSLFSRGKWGRASVGHSVTCRYYVNCDLHLIYIVVFMTLIQYLYTTDYSKFILAVSIVDIIGTYLLFQQYRNKCMPPSLWKENIYDR